MCEELAIGLCLLDLETSFGHGGREDARFFD
jgi:hypothetical protein